MHVFTIGHSNHSWFEFVSTLVNNNVNILIDVRRFPHSKVFPQFNKEEISKQLQMENIDYIHIEKLGGRRKQIITGKFRYDNKGWKNKSFKAYADYMTSESFREGIDEMLSVITNYSNSSIMCSEAVPWRCHRRMISDYLTMVNGISVFDIINIKQPPRIHRLTPFAHLAEDKVIIYSKNDY